MSWGLKRYVMQAAAPVSVAAVIAIVVFVQLYGGWSEVLQLPAVVEQGSPLKQGGFSLVDVTRGRPDDANVTLPNGSRMFLAAPQSSGDTILWIAPPLLPPTRLLRAATSRESDQLESFYTVRVITPDGSKFKIPWYYEGGCLDDGGEPCVDARIASVSPHIIASVIPGGYPGSITWLKVTISDRYRHRASWLLTRLPKMVCADTKADRPTFEQDGASIGLTAIRAQTGQTTHRWPSVKFFITVHRLTPRAKHRWALFQSRTFAPTLSWQPIKLPWMVSTSDQSPRSPDPKRWLLSHDTWSTSEFFTISSPYADRSSSATFHGVLVQYETRIDSVHLRDVHIDTIYAAEAGMPVDTYCIDLKHKVELISASGLTFALPAQRSSFKNFLKMEPGSLNLLWHLSPLTPGHTSETAAVLPDSLLYRTYHRPVAVWFEAIADGKSLGVGDGLPDTADIQQPIMVHFWTPLALPPVIHDLTITVHQRVDLQRIHITLTTRIRQPSSRI